MAACRYLQWFVKDVRDTAEPESWVVPPSACQRLQSGCTHLLLNPLLKTMMQYWRKVADVSKAPAGSEAVASQAPPNTPYRSSSFTQILSASSAHSLLGTCCPRGCYGPLLAVQRFRVDSRLNHAGGLPRISATFSVSADHRQQSMRSPWSVASTAVQAAAVSCWFTRAAKAALCAANVACRSSVWVFSCASCWACASNACC